MLNMQPLELEGIDLTEQITDTLKGKWYYQQIADRLEVKKNAVIFDNDFIFELKKLTYNDDIIPDEIIIKLNGETINDDETITSYGNGKRQESTSEILDAICCYIANRI